MPEEKWESIEGIVDVGPIVVAHCDNPARGPMIDFLGHVLAGEIPALVPMNCLLGAYHVLTRDLRVPRRDVVLALQRTLQVDSPAFYEKVTRLTAIEAMTTAAIEKVAGWDGYLVSLAKQYGTRVIFSLDRQLGRVEGIDVILPIPEVQIEAYHKWLEEQRG